MKATRFLKRVTAVALLVSLSLAVIFFDHTRTHAASPTTTTQFDKVSPDLRQLIQSGQGSTHVKAIVQSAPSSSPNLLGSLLQAVNGVVLATLSNLNITLVDIQASSAEVLASDPSISYVSLDTQVVSFGHVTNTTGTQQSRTQKGLLGLTYTLDGSDVKIAVLDSGIDVTHKSFSGQLGKIAFSKDFTGENRTDDPYGHGTHVAAVAAGIAQPVATTRA